MKSIPSWSSVNRCNPATSPQLSYKSRGYRQATWGVRENEFATLKPPSINMHVKSSFHANHVLEKALLWRQTLAWVFRSKIQPFSPGLSGWNSCLATSHIPSLLHMRTNILNAFEGTSGCVLYLGITFKPCNLQTLSPTLKESNLKWDDLQKIPRKYHLPACNTNRRLTHCMSKSSTFSRVDEVAYRDCAVCNLLRKSVPGDDTPPHLCWDIACRKTAQSEHRLQYINFFIYGNMNLTW